MSERDGLSAVERYRLAAEARRTGPPLRVEPIPDLAADTMWRGLARDGALRMLVVRGTEAVSQNAQALGCDADMTRLVGEALLCSLLVRSTLNPAEQLQAHLRHDGAAGRIVVDIWADRGMRATVEHRTASADQAIGEGTFEVARSRVGHPVYRSSVRAQPTIADCAMHYLAGSEQIVSLLRTEVIVQNGAVTFAGGFLVQMMPESQHDDLQTLLDNLAALQELRGGMTTDDPDGCAWAGDLLNGFRWDQVAREEVAYVCNCSQARVLTMLSALPRAELQEMADSDEVIETTCEYCNTTYKVGAAQLRKLLEPPN